MSDVMLQIKQVVESSDVVVFMKGTRRVPQCGFSAQVVSILDELLPNYATVNVLEDPALRQGIKEFSSWPTIPQVYIRGEFVGGCDILREMHASGELQQKLGGESLPPPEPKLKISAEAKAAIESAFEGPDDRMRLEIDARYQHGLSIGPKESGDIELNVDGLLVVMDRGSAMRADGVEIAFVDTPQGSAFRIDNPNEPPKVRALSVQELKALLDGGEPLELFDVRTPEERAIASINGARLLDDEAQAHILSLPRDTPLYFHCHHGGRSQAAAEHFLGHGYLKVYNLVGGIDSWAREIEPSLTRY